MGVFDSDVRVGVGVGAIARTSLQHSKLSTTPCQMNGFHLTRCFNGEKVETVCVTESLAQSLESMQRGLI